MPTCYSSGQDDSGVGLQTRTGGKNKKPENLLELIDGKKNDTVKVLNVVGKKKTISVSYFYRLNACNEFKLT